ncbi:MAG: IS4 family transposase [Paenibacillaceae bacterium]|nr:IS4 family transposase [Paenibacillaceae bacterium]
MGNVPNHNVMRQCFSWLQVNYRDFFHDYRARKLCTGNTVFLFLEAALQQRPSLKNIADHLASRKWLQEWLDLDSIHGSSLYRKLEALPLDLLQDMFTTLVQAIGQHYAGKTGVDRLGKLRAIDSTTIRLPAVYGSWAYVSKSKNAVKMHTCLLVGDENSVCPQRVVLSTADVSDLDKQVVMELVTESLDTYVFDRGYINYAHYCKWQARKIRFVARVKASNKFRLLTERDVSPNSHVTRDADVELTDAKSGATVLLRLVEYTYRDDKNKLRRIRVLTNRWDLTAEEITDIYRYRWKIELFFKWMKQHVQLTKLYNHSEEAVWNQIYLALIAYALCELLRLTVAPESSCWNLLQALQLYADLPMEACLGALGREPTRTSQGRQKKAKRGRPRIHPEVKRPAHKVIK